MLGISSHGRTMTVAMTTRGAGANAKALGLELVLPYLYGWEMGMSCKPQLQAKHFFRSEREFQWSIKRVDGDTLVSNTPHHTTPDPD